MAAISGIDIITKPPFVFLPIIGALGLLGVLAYWALGNSSRNRTSALPASVVHRSVRPDYGEPFGASASPQAPLAPPPSEPIPIVEPPAAGEPPAPEPPAPEPLTPAYWPPTPPTSPQPVEPPSSEWPPPPLPAAPPELPGAPDEPPDLPEPSE